MSSLRQFYLKIIDQWPITMYTILHEALHTRRTKFVFRQGDTGKIANKFALIANHDLHFAGPSHGWFI
jgi:hypothetical protein